MRRQARAAALLEILPATYPDAHCELDYGDAYELLAATMLSAQCTDKRVNMVTPALFADYPDPQALAVARQADVEEIIRSTGFYRNKAKNLIAAARTIVELHGGEVPATMAELTALPGVGRKTANVVLGNAFDINEGIVVDTHVGRLARRLGLTGNTDPEKVERDLVKLVQRERWTVFSHWLIWHGRARCKSQNPDCAGCELAKLCPSAGKAAVRKPGKAARKRGLAAKRRSTG